MKVRESGMPDESYWKSFFDVNKIFTLLQLNNEVADLVEFGSGYGTFTVPASEIVKGKIYALEIEPEMISHLSDKILTENLPNIILLQRDFVLEGTGLRENSIDYVMLFNILHAEHPEILLNEAYRILKPGGKAGIIHWIHSPATPRGPSLDIRPNPAMCIKWLLEARFNIVKNEISLPPYHYGILAEK